MRSSLFTIAGAAAFLAVLVVGVIVIASSAGTGASAATPSGELTGPTAWGNLDCSADGVTTRDNQALLRFVLDQNPLSQTEPCPNIGDMVLIEGFGEFAWGSVDCSADGVTTRDNQALLRFVLDQNPLSQTEPCPDIGATVMSGTPTPTPTPDPARTVDLVAIDAVITGNTPTSIGPIEDCVSVGVSDQVEVDIVVDEIPAAGIAGFTSYLGFDSTKLAVSAVDTLSQMLAANGATVIDFSGPDPADPTNSYIVAAADLNDPAGETGKGVLARVTLTGLAAGVTGLDLSLAPPQGVINDGTGLGTYSILDVQSADIAVGTACP